MPQLEPKHSAFHSLCIRPDTRFLHQRQGEEVLVTVRAHPITLLLPFFNGIVVCIGIFALNSFVLSLVSFGQFIYLNLFMLFLVFMYYWVVLVTWYFNMGIITNEEILDVDFQPFGSKEVTRTELNKIEDITARGSGFFASIFNFGNVFIQTAGTEINTEFFNVPNPGKVAYLIQEIKETYGGHSQ